MFQLWPKALAPLSLLSDALRLASALPEGIVKTY